MKEITTVICICTTLYSFSCAGRRSETGDNKNNTPDTITATTITEKPDSFATGKIIPQVFCKNDASQSYALYIPTNNNKEKLPVIYFFDPHADGALPLNKYKELADKYHFILVGSNNSKNGNDWSTTENTWDKLFNDVQKRLPVSESRIYTCGFSGGAKVASYIALQHPVIKGVIAGGAGLPDGTAANNFDFSFTAITGEADMNMTDLVSISNDLDKTKTKHRIIFFKGKHEWCPQTTMDIAFAGLQLDAMSVKEIPEDNSFINNYISESRKRLNDFIADKDLIAADRECKISTNMLTGLGNTANFFKEKDASVKNNTLYQSQLKVQQTLFEKEETMKAVYQRQFEQGDLNYWTTTINDLQTKAKASDLEASMYQRLLAYLSLAFYSISNQLINSNQNEQAAYFVELYKKVDPTNSEAWYFSAILDARNNNARAVEDDLLQAVANGFIDESRMMQQPEFQNVASQVNFSKIETEIRSKK